MHVQNITHFLKVWDSTLLTTLEMNMHDWYYLASRIKYIVIGHVCNDRSPEGGTTGFKAATCSSGPGDASRETRILQLARIPEDFQTDSGSFPFPFLWMAAVLCFRLHFSPRAIHKKIKIKTKQNNNRKLSGRSLEPVGARGWENILAAVTPSSTESLQGSVCLVKCHVEGRAAGGSCVTRTRPGARAGSVSDIVFPLIEVSGPNSWKIGGAGSPCRGFHWAGSVRESRERRILSQERRGPWAGGGPQPAGMGCGFEAVWESMCTGGMAGGKEGRRAVCSDKGFFWDEHFSLSAHLWIPKGKRSSSPWFIPPGENIISKPGLLSCQLYYDLTSKGRTSFSGHESILPCLFSLVCSS